MDETTKDETLRGNAAAEPADLSPEEADEGQGGERGFKKDKKLLRELLETEQSLTEAVAKLEAKTAECAAQQDKCLRLAAEYDNFRKRTAAERQGAYIDGLETALSGILPILDNLERAALYSDAEGVAQGLALTARSAAEAIAALGVEPFGAVGETFDPALHNAVIHIEDEVHGTGEITEVHQRGYKKGARVLRYAMVTVAN